MTQANRRSPVLPLLLTALLVGTVAVSWPSNPSPIEPQRADVVANGGAGQVAQLGEAGSSRQNATAMLAPWAAPIGSRFVHRLVDRLTVTLSSTEAGAMPAGSLHTRCQVQTLVVDRRGEETLLQQQISALVCLDSNERPIEDDRAVARYVAAATAPVLVSIDRHGKLLRYGFADGLDGDQRNFLRGTLGLLCCEAPRDDGSHWHGTGVDTTGEYRVRYEVLGTGRDGLQLRRSKLGYTSICGQDELPQHQVRGVTVLAFDAATAWLASVDLEEELTIALPLAEMKAITQRNAQVRLQASDTVARAALPAPDWARLQHGPSSQGEVLGADAAEHERERWQRKLANLSLTELLADLQALFAAEPVDAEAVDARFQELQWLLRLREDAIAELAAGLRQQAIGEAAARVGIGALGAAGTSAAQDALADCLSDSGLSAGLREAATFACLQLGEPSPRLLGNLLAIAESSADNRGSAMLVAGALAGRSNGPLADGSSALTQLLAMRSAAEARGELDSWLLAVSNAKAPQTLALAVELARHPTAAVRIAACVALSELPAIAALNTLLERLRTDDNDEVRGEAMLALAQRGEVEARAAIEHAARHDRSLVVRQRAERLLQREQ